MSIKSTGGGRQPAPTQGRSSRWRRRFGLAAVACIGLIGVAAPSAGARAGSQLSLSYGVAHGAGVRVVKITASRSIRTVRVQWGDGHASTVSRNCAASPSPSPTGTLLVPHRYTANARYHVVARVAAFGCAASSSRRANVVAADMRVTGVHHQAASARPAMNSAAGWVSFDQAAPLANATYTVAQGAPQAGGGCSFPSVSASLPPGGPASVAENEVSVNPATCSELMETGTPTGPAALVAPSQPGSSSTTVAPAPPTTTAARAAYTVRESAGYWNAYWEDPIQIPLGQTIDYTHWRWNGGCVTESAPGGNYSVNHWNSDTGWFVAGTNTFFKQDCYQNLTQTTSYFQDNKFCGGQTTYANLVNNYVSGHYDGGLVGRTESPSVGGHCTNLLDYQARLVRTQ